MAEAKFSSTDKSYVSLAEAAASAMEQLQDEDCLEIDNDNWEAAIIALSEMKKVKKVVKLFDRLAPRETLPVGTIMEVANHCKIMAYFLDSFYHGNRLSVDTEHLDIILNNKTILLTHFFGHLDEAGIKKLPKSVNTLGLSIGFRENARAIKHLVPWYSLKYLGVSVSSEMKPEDLRVLPKSVENKGIYFPDYYDSLLYRVRPAINTMVPDQKVCRIFFPSCSASYNGIRYLARELRGLEITEDITFDFYDQFKFSEDRKRDIEDRFRISTNCPVKWEMGHFLF